MVICKRVLYSGRVQGVGFRYTTQRVAEDFRVKGYVQNLPTGEVELVAEGEAQTVNAFLAAVAKRMARYIDDVREFEESARSYGDFSIRH